MKVPEECKCKVCKSVFCCAQCRSKHETAAHAIAVRSTKTIGTIDNSNRDSSTTTTKRAAEMNSEMIYIFCPICEQKPLLLQTDMYEELLAHIEDQHLPLRCKKCNKLYSKIHDLRQFSKCLNTLEKFHGQECSTTSNQTCDTDTSKVTVKQLPVAHSTMSTQTSPMRPNQTHKDFNETEHLTPISIINMRWKAKSKITHDEFISDSVSSIKNLSTVSNNSLRRSITQVPPTVTKGKLIRSTSTPLQVDTVSSKAKEPTFNASGGHVSSIYNSGLESDNSPAVAPVINGTSAQAIDNMNRYRKVGARGKMSAVTPLRQVMSKSIQKAFVEHGGLPRSSMLQRRNMFDVTDNSAPDDANSANYVQGDEAGPVPLDLRLSPAIRRTQSESSSSTGESSKSTDLQIDNREFKMLSSQKCTTMKSIVITCTKVVAANVATSSLSSATTRFSTSTDINANNGSGSNNSAASSNGTSTNSVYKSCESVEIITATAELSSVNVAGICSAPPLTPITRIPGAVINKKLIKFETPVKEQVKAESSATSLPASPDEVFFTPNPGTPVRTVSNDHPNSKQRKQAVVRKLCRRFSPPQPRAHLRDCTQNAAFSRLEDISGDHSEYDVDDEVFLPDKESTKQELKKSTEDQFHEQDQGAGRLWTLMTSVMRLPKFKSVSSGLGKQDDSTSVPDANSISILKRCASIAGSLVRPKLMYEDQIKPLKRKRTHTLDSQSSYSSAFNYTDSVSPPSTSSKRIRIQSRKPIERMRLNS